MKDATIEFIPILTSGNKKDAATRTNKTTKEKITNSWKHKVVKLCLCALLFATMTANSNFADEKTATNAEIDVIVANKPKFSGAYSLVKTGATRNGIICAKIFADSIAANAFANELL